MTAMNMDAFKALNKQWEHEHSEAVERFKFRDAAVASLKKHLAEEKRVEEARKRPLSKEDNSLLAQTAREVHRNDRELRRIEKIMRTNINRYYEERLDARYRELTRP